MGSGSQSISFEGQESTGWMLWEKINAAGSMGVGQCFGRGREGVEGCQWDQRKRESAV